MVGIPQLFDVMRNHASGVLKEYVFDPYREVGEPGSLAFALSVLSDSVVEAPSFLLPIMAVDDGSFACAVCDREIFDPNLKDGTVDGVVRWHLGLVNEDYQGEPLDNDALAFIASKADEIKQRPHIIRNVNRTAATYYENFVVKGDRPKPEVLRPVQLACQNVIVGLATLQHDPIFDGLRVPAYTTCEAPHLAAGEADRAMVALVLCDAFRSGGTMEIKFGTRRRARKTPPSLTRYARTRDLSVGDDDDTTISPREARELFLAVTPMPEELRLRALEAFDAGVITPERLCYSLMAGVWSQVELDFLLATTPRTARILKGGADPIDRLARCSEQESCRAALMAGMLVKRLDNATQLDTSDESIDVIEDKRAGTGWSIRGECAAIALEISEISSIPWLWTPTAVPSEASSNAPLIALPRANPTLDDVELTEQIASWQRTALVALLIPKDVDPTPFTRVPVLRCPKTQAELDQVSSQKLGELKVGRK